MTSTVLEALRGGLVVSCQAYPGEPMRHPETLTQIAEAAVRGGAVGIRAQGLDDIRSIHARVALPQIGLWKDGDGEVFITPTLVHAVAVARAGAEVVALDGTRRTRPDGLSLAETIRRLREETGVLVMADVGSLDDALAAEDAGADCVSTTLCGYTAERPKTDGPDLEVLAAAAGRLTIPVFAEGRIHTPPQATACRDAGAFAVVVGTAITHPTTITGWFAAAVGADGER
ncbi:putative N-acetylmannosamine-6-phosphate 2-epimerase [Frondihabitans sucicola]|uniref:Putative N-acetylmannosamine-6-phosphate 2-epimerase n=1 Tax=Frondihabitans sucicola TaxID=1268041 RepID=A0ABN6XZ24_9MICO|nr:N-acetylmannosamine-6-phosphate 2-epimerase [Frondihabitans sucicola]BDZ49368.1 putative N-acetylmannosamine-6-phosphate 2-epimerase [Frondihabitans sucicola]